MPLDFASFNELSLVTGRHSTQELVSLLQGLAATFHEAWLLGLRRVRVHSNFSLLCSTDDTPVTQLIHSLPINDRRVILRSTDAPHIKDSEFAAADTYLASKNVVINGVSVNDAEGLICAFINETVAISAATDAFQNCIHVEFSSTDLRNGNVQNALIPHAASQPQLRRHVAVIGRLTFKPKDHPCSRENPLPNSEYVNRFYVQDNWVELLKRCALPSTYSIPIIEDIARDVALMNGYDFEPDLTRLNHRKRNSKRQIFSSVEPAQEIFLSTDFEKGAFEVCDRHGRHLGEWLFSGSIHKNADTSGDHDIFLS